MNLKKRIICFFKEHQHTITVNLDSLQVNAECTRCGNRLSEEEALHILRTGTIVVDNDMYP